MVCSLYSILLKQGWYSIHRPTSQSSYTVRIKASIGLNIVQSWQLQKLQKIIHLIVNNGLWTIRNDSVQSSPRLDVHNVCELHMSNVIVDCIWLILLHSASTDPILFSQFIFIVSFVSHFCVPPYCLDLGILLLGDIIQALLFFACSSSNAC